MLIIVYNNYFFNSTDHLMNMLNNAVYSKKITFKTVLFDGWYATHKIMQHVDKLGKIYYAPIKANRNVARVNSSVAYKPVAKLELTKDEINNGVEIHIKGFAKNTHVKLFQHTVSTNRVELEKLAAETKIN